MPHLIFQIDEILRPIAEYVGQISRPTAIEFARCCRAFEEPALSPLWESTTLGNLMYVLPEDVLYFGGLGLCVVRTLSSVARSANSVLKTLTHFTEDLPTTQSCRTPEVIPIRVVGQKDHGIRDRRSSLFPPGPLWVTHRRPVSKPTRTPRLDRTRPSSVPSPLRVATFDALFCARGH